MDRLIAALEASDGSPLTEEDIALAEVKQCLDCIVGLVAWQNSTSADDAVSLEARMEEFFKSEQKKLKKKKKSTYRPSATIRQTFEHNLEKPLGMFQAVTKIRDNVKRTVSAERSINRKRAPFKISAQGKDRPSMSTAASRIIQQHRASSLDLQSVDGRSHSPTTRDGSPMEAATGLDGDTKSEETGTGGAVPPYVQLSKNGTSCGATQQLGSLVQLNFDASSAKVPSTIKLVPCSKSQQPKARSGWCSNVKVKPNLQCLPGRSSNAKIRVPTVHTQLSTRLLQNQEQQPHLLQKQEARQQEQPALQEDEEALALRKQQGMEATKIAKIAPPLSKWQQRAAAISKASAARALASASGGGAAATDRAPQDAGEAARSD
jgi:hypothetical protein